MLFELSEAQKMLKTAARNFMESEVVPIAGEYDQHSPLPRDLAQKQIRKLIPLGYVGSTIPQEDGGAGLDPVSYGILLEELARAYASLALIVLIQGGMAKVIWSSNEHLRAQYLSPLLSAEMIGCGGFTEANVGSNVGGLETQAKRHGQHYVINGTKMWITNGGIADLALVLAQTDPGKGVHGVSAIIADKRFSPFEARELHKVGLRSSSTAELSFQDCRVPVANLVGEEGHGLAPLLNRFEFSRSALSIMSVGIAQAAIDASVKYARERMQFGKPIGSFQLVQQLIVDMVMKTDAARLLALRAFDLIGRNASARKEASMAKAYAVEMAVQVTSKAMQVHGAYGLFTEYPLERYFRDAKTMTIPDGTTEIQKLIAGRDIVGISAFV